MTLYNRYDNLIGQGNSVISELSQLTQFPPLSNLRLMSCDSCRSPFLLILNKKNKCILEIS